MGRDFAAERSHWRSEMLRKDMGILTSKEKTELARRKEEARKKAAKEAAKGLPLLLDGGER